MKELPPLVISLHNGPLDGESISLPIPIRPPDKLALLNDVGEVSGYYFLVFDEDEGEALKYVWT